MAQERLNGTVLEWDEAADSFAQVAITEEEASRLEEQGEVVIRIAGTIIHARETVPEDGTIALLPKSDMLGRAAASGGHTNYGFSGYFKGYVYLSGKRRVVRDWSKLFPNNEHHYRNQQVKGETIDKIRAIIESHAGKPLVKVRGGYAVETGS